MLTQSSAARLFRAISILNVAGTADRIQAAATIQKPARFVRYMSSRPLRRPSAFPCITCRWNIARIY
jgi:hypothetical protein